MLSFDLTKILCEGFYISNYVFHKAFPSVTEICSSDASAVSMGWELHLYYIVLLKAATAEPLILSNTLVTVCAPIMNMNDEVII